jgi:carbon storage regulator
MAGSQFIGPKTYADERSEPMLVLSRKPGERILVPQYGVEITVVAVQGNKVRLGIAAPDAVAVYREEVLQKLTREKGP